MARLTPMFRQYLEIKQRYPDAILFFRLGDFYEMFFEDALLASRLLDITLTSREKGTKEKVPMCGVPAANAAPYINRLVEAGYKVAICEQIEDPKEAKGLVKREVIRVVTPGLNVDEDSLSAKDHQYLAAISDGEKGFGLAFLDLSTGDFRATEFRDEEALLNELFRLEPKEILIPKDFAEKLQEKIREILPRVYFSKREAEDFSQRKGLKKLLETFGLIDLSGLGFPSQCEAIGCASAILGYLEETQRCQLKHLNPPKFYLLSHYLVIDETTKRNLELLRNSFDGGRKGTLLWVLDRTLTPMGGRLLKEWILYPVRDLEEIYRRQRAIGFLVEETHLRKELSRLLRRVTDIERLLARCAMKIATPRDLLSLKESLKTLPELKTLLGKTPPGLLTHLYEELLDLSPLAEEIEKTISPEAPSHLKEGGVIKEGVHAELDELRRLKEDGLSFLAELEARERKRTGIPNLKVGYNRVFGYYLEVSKSHLAKVPPDYIRKQTLVGGERFITPELKEFEAKVLSAEERIKVLEQEIFYALRDRVVRLSSELKKISQALAQIDVILSLAEVAVENRYVPPEMTLEKVIEIEEGRHPVVEKALPSGSFVSNSIRLNDDELLLIITGPNMAGKSTILRQTALIVLMAHMGSFVPADRARIGLCDRIFTRVGASDQLSRGRSTFMVEMTECANILHQATDRSLVILDEIGRGTSTFDGLSIAWAVAEFLLKKRVMTLFATHYHELTELADTDARVRNYNVAVKTWEDEIVFLYRLLPGAASESYGIQVAALAGLPKEVVERAKEILARLERQEGLKASQKGLKQKTLFEGESLLKQHLRNLDPNRLSPLEALELLYELRRLAEKF